MQERKQIEDFANRIQNFCNKSNIEFKYREDVKTDSYIFRFLKDMKEIQMKFTVMELIEAPFTAIVTQKIQDKMSGLIKCQKF